MGAGAGIGGTVGRRFASEGYHAVLCRRSNAAGLKTLIKGIEQAGGTATGFILNAVEDDQIERKIAEVEESLGPINVVIFNLGAQTGNHSLADTSLRAFEIGWRMATFALFRTAKAVFPHMQARGHGALIVTSSTAAMRGNRAQHAHTSAMSARRTLCQSLNAEFSSQGIHVAHVIVDGLVDAPDTVGKILGEEKYQALREARGLEKDGLILPDQVAETYFHLAHQHRSSWTFEMALRAFSDKPWWND
jgi:NAD(P)-dependent dehydrogenase (short-subunit alcohol dehydrogenase family)